VEPEVVEEILEEIQKFDPPGIGARNLQEALQIQMEHLGLEDTYLKTMIQYHLGDVQRKRYDRISKALGIELERVYSLLKKLSTLEPKPARLYERGEPHYILPDIIVSKVDEKFIVELNDERWIPTLRISSYYKKLVSEGDKEIRSYIKERIRSALWFVKCIEQRKEILLRIAEVIFAWQHDFLIRGPEGLKPLTLKDVADIVKLHPATVSRATSRKFAQTPWGTFPLRYFFAGGVNNGNDKAISTQTVKQKIKELIAEENPSKPLSDDKIAKVLSESGISIARRTVSKYREQLGILPSNLRKK
jgi:RNA polymerase sigma-54 factor